MRGSQGNRQHYPIWHLSAVWGGSELRLEEQVIASVGDPAGLVGQWMLRAPALYRDRAWTYYRRGMDRYSGTVSIYFSPHGTVEAFCL